GSEVPWTEVEFESRITKAYWGQRQLLTIKDGVLYCRWVTPDGLHETLSLVAPKNLRLQIMTQAHAGFHGGHVSLRKTLAVLKLKAYWGGMKADTFRFIEH